jgi:ribosomal protein L37AE/L43A
MKNKRNPFMTCPVCSTIGSVMIKENHFECSKCESTLSYKEYNKNPINGVVMPITKEKLNEI